MSLPDDNIDESKSGSNVVKSSHQELVMNEASESMGTISLARATLLGLLASSCCLLQLGLNLLSAFDIVHIGCAGFNKVLGGQVRLGMRIVTIVWLIFCWAVMVRKRRKDDCCTGSEPGVIGGKSRRQQIRRLVWLTLFTILLTFLPEILRGSGVAGGANNLITKPLYSASDFPDVVHEAHTSQHQLNFVVDNMGCEACESIVRHVIEKSNGVTRAAVDWETGQAEIWVSSESQFDFEHVDARLKHHGYELHYPGHMTKKMQMLENSKDAENPFEMTI